MKDIPIISKIWIKITTTTIITYKIKTELLLKVIWIIQRINLEYIKLKTNIYSKKKYNLKNGILYIDNWILISNNPILKTKLFQLYYNNIFAKYFDKEKIIELLKRNYI